MSKFYTNIEVRGNNILYRGYENGLPVQRKIEYRPHLFVKTTEETKYKVFKSGIPVKKRVFDSISDMKQFTEQYKDVPNFNIYGCSNIVRQFTGAMFPVEIVWDYTQTKIWFFDIETRVDRLLVDAKTEVVIRHRSAPEIEKKVIAYSLLNLHTDWEVLGKNGKWGTSNASGFVAAGFPNVEYAREEVLMVSLYDRFNKKLHLWSLIKASDSNPIFENFKDVNFQYFEDEKQLLKSFIFFFADNRVDILSGWNSELFDVPFIVNRIKNVLGETALPFLSPWRSVKQRTIRNDDGSTDIAYDISGVVHLDYMVAYKKFNPGSKESFKLDFIAELELGEKKVEVPGESFREGYILYPEIFVEYSAVDTMLLNKMEDKLLQVRLAMQLAYLARCQITDVLSSMRLWESIIYNYFLDINLVEDWNKPRNEKHKIVGAYVHEPVPGKYGWTVSVDATSKYPSIMMQNNLSPETIVDFFDHVTMDGMLHEKHSSEVPEGCILSCNGLVTRTDVQGFIPILVKRFFDLRSQLKKQMLEKKKELETVRNELKSLGVSV